MKRMNETDTVVNVKREIYLFLFCASSQSLFPSVNYKCEK